MSLADGRRVPPWETRVARVWRPVTLPLWRYSSEDARWQWVDTVDSVGTGVTQLAVQCIEFSYGCLLPLNE